MAKVELKQPIVEEIAGNLEGAQGVVLCEYRGLTVEQDTQLRKNLREAGVKYKVYKNTLVKRAIEGSAFESLKDDLTGPTAIAISDTDATAPATTTPAAADTPNSSSQAFTSSLSSITDKPFIASMISSLVMIILLL